MRINNTIFLVLFLASSLFCQERKKNFIIGGSFNINHSKYDNPNGYELSRSSIDVAFVESERFSYYLLLNIGRIIDNKSIAGVFGSYGNLHGKYYSELENAEVYSNMTTRDNNYNIGFFYRRNVFAIAKAKFFIQPMLSYINGTEKNESRTEFYSSTLISNHGLDFSVDSGVSFSLANKWNLLIKLPFLNYTSTIETREREIDSFSYDKIQDKGTDLTLELNLRYIQIGVERIF